MASDAAVSGRICVMADDGRYCPMCLVRPPAVRGRSGPRSSGAMVVPAKSTCRSVRSWPPTVARGLKSHCVPPAKYCPGAGVHSLGSATREAVSRSTQPSKWCCPRAERGETSARERVVS